MLAVRVRTAREGRNARMDNERRPTTGHRAPTRAMVLAWADAHMVDISNAEADDLVRRLWHPPAPFEPEAVEQCVTDALLLLAESEGHDEPTAEGLRRLAARASATMLALGLVDRARCVLPNDEEQPVPSGERETVSPGGVAEREEAEDDGVPGSAFGEGEGQALRFDAIYLLKPVVVMLHGKRATAIWPPSFGRVKLKLDGSRRSVVVALDELDDAGRGSLLTAPVRRRTEIAVRCSVRRCSQAYRAWIREDSRIEDTKGKPFAEFGSLFAARCEEHRLAR